MPNPLTSLLLFFLFAAIIMESYVPKDLDIARTRLRRKPNDSIQKISEGSYEDLAVLIDNYYALTTSQRSRYVISLSCFLSSLGWKQIRAEENMVTNVAGYVQFLKGVCLAGDLHDSLSEEAQTAYQSLVPDVVHIIFLLNDKLHGAAKDDSFCRRFKIICRKITYSFCTRIDHSNSDTPALESVSALSLIMWMEDEVDTAENTLALKSLAISLSQLQKTDKENRFLTDVEPRMASHALAWLRALIVRISTFDSLDALADCCRVVSIISDYHHIAQRLIAEDAIGMLCAGLSRFRSSSENETTLGAFLTILLCLRQLITLSLECSKQALRSDLIGNIAHTYLRISSQPCYESLLPIFGTEINGTLRPLLIYGSAIRKMLQAINELSSFDRTSLARDKVIGPMWSGLEELLLERAVAFRLFSFHRAEGTYKCCNPECRWKSRRRFLLRCAACREAAYCSKLCQRQHWRKYEHGKECRVLRDFASVMGVRLIRDRSFVIFLAAIEVKRRISGLRELASSKFPQVPFDHIGFHVEFCCYPVSIDVFEICDKQDYDTSYPLALKADGELSLLRITVDRGQRVCTLHILARINKELTPTANDVPFFHNPASDAFGNAPEVTPEIIDWVVSDIIRMRKKSGLEKPWCISMIDERIKAIYKSLAGQ